MRFSNRVKVEKNQNCIKKAGFTRGNVYQIYFAMSTAALRAFYKINVPLLNLVEFYNKKRYVCIDRSGSS